MTEEVGSDVGRAVALGEPELARVADSARDAVPLWQLLVSAVVAGDTVCAIEGETVAVPRGDTDGDGDDVPNVVSEKEPAGVREPPAPEADESAEAAVVGEALPDTV